MHVGFVQYVYGMQEPNCRTETAADQSLQVPETHLKRNLIIGLVHRIAPKSAKVTCCYPCGASHPLLGVNFCSLACSQSVVNSIRIHWLCQSSCKFGVFNSFDATSMDRCCHSLYARLQREQAFPSSGLTSNASGMRFAHCTCSFATAADQWTSWQQPAVA